MQDEVHTRFHASAASLGELFANLRLDNYPPLGFLLVRVSRNLMGDSELALRAPLSLCGLLGTLTLARLCAQLGASPLTGAALWALYSTRPEVGCGRASRRRGIPSDDPPDRLDPATRDRAYPSEYCLANTPRRLSLRCAILARSRGGQGSRTCSE